MVAARTATGVATIAFTVADGVATVVASEVATGVATGAATSAAAGTHPMTRPTTKARIAPMDCHPTLWLVARVVNLGCLMPVAPVPKLLGTVSGTHSASPRVFIVLMPGAPGRPLVFERALLIATPPHAPPIRPPAPN